MTQTQDIRETTCVPVKILEWYYTKTREHGEPKSQIFVSQT